MKYWTMRTKIHVLILIAVTPFLILQFDDVVSRYEHSIEVELQANQEFAEAIRATLINYFQNIWDLENAIGQARFAGHEPLTVEQMERYMNELMSRHPTICGIVWVDPAGMIVASTEPRIRGKSVAGRSYYQEAVQGQENFVSDLTHVDIADTALLPVTRTIYHDGEMAGIIVVTLDLRRLNLILPVKLQGKTGAFGFIDRNGYIVYYYRQDDVALQPVPIRDDSPAWQALRGEDVLTQGFYSSMTGEIRMGAFLPVSPVGWAVFATIAVDEVLVNANLTTYRDLLVLILAFIIFIVAALLLSNHFLRPLISLQDAAQAIAEGQLNARARISGSDELAVTGAIFDHMADQVQQLEVSRSRFLQTAAHELRNPMAGIKGLVSLISRRIEKGQTAQEILPLLPIIEREIDRLSVLLNQILEAFRTQRENGLLFLNRQKVNLTELIEKALEPFKNAENRCTFYLDPIMPEPLWVCGDALRLEEVLRNLLGNAVKYSPNGGTITVKLRKQDDTHVLIGVTDEGMGIPPEHLQSIFKCFHRAIENRHEDPGGLGLGLYICKEIVHKHGGLIWAESVFGQGSTFFIELPLVDADYENCQDSGS